MFNRQITSLEPAPLGPQQPTQPNGIYEFRQAVADKEGSIFARLAGNSPPVVEQERELRAAGLVAAFVRTCERWRLDRSDQAVLLGYGDNSLGALGVLSGRVKIPTVDVRERATLIVQISLILGAMFDERIPAEISWLKAIRNALGGRSALETLLGGHLSDIWRVYAFLNDERNA